MVFVFVLPALVLPAVMVRWAVTAGCAARVATAGERESAEWAARCTAARQAVEAIRGDVA